MPVHVFTRMRVVACDLVRVFGVGRSAGRVGARRRTGAGGGRTAGGVGNQPSRVRSRWGARTGGDACAGVSDEGARACIDARTRRSRVECRAGLRIRGRFNGVERCGLDGTQQARAVVS